jgi:hypothetical protein
VKKTISFLFSFFVPIFFITFLTASQSAEARLLGCSKAEKYLEEYSNRQVVLVKIVEDFDAFYAGNITDEMSMSSLFVVDLKDPEQVNQRIIELSQPIEKTDVDFRITKECDVKIDDFVEINEYISDLEESIRISRLEFLKKPEAIRIEVIQLIKSAVDIDRIAKSQYALIETKKADSDVLVKTISKLENKLASVVDSNERNSGMDELLDLKSKLEINAQVLLVLEPTYQKIIGYKSSLKQLLKLYLAKNIASVDVARFKALWRKLFYYKFDISSFFTIDTFKNGSELPDVELLLAKLPWQLQLSLHHFEKYMVSTNAAIDSGYELSDEWLMDLRCELLHLIRIPLAPYFLEWYSISQEGAESTELDFVIKHSVSLLSGLGIFIFLAYMLLKLPAWIARRQVSLLRQNRDAKHRVYLALILRGIRPHALWLPMYVFISMLPKFSLSGGLLLIVLHALGVIFYSYYFLSMLTEWLIGRMHFRSHVVVSSVDQEKISNTTKIFTVYLIIVYSLTNTVNVINLYGSIANTFSTMALLCYWLIIYRHIAKYKDIALKFFNQRSNEAYYRLWKDRPTWYLFFTLPVLFFIFHIVDLGILAHKSLLRFEIYQKFSAKILKIRLEQLQQEEDEDEELEANDAYERWFAKKPKSSVPVVTLQNSIIPDVNKCIRSWMKGRNEENDLLICGENGSGKTTLINQWKEQWEDSDILYIDVPAKTITVKDFYSLLDQYLIAGAIEKTQDIQKLDADFKDTVIIIDNAHNLFLADEYGFEAYKALLDCINVRLNNIFWMVISNDRAANYLNYVFGSRRQFSYHLTLPKWSQQDIRQLIMARHTASRRKLSFNELLLSSIGSDDSAAAVAAETRCFNLLWDQSGGNPSVAMELWIEAASKVKNFGIEIGIPERPSVNAIKELNNDLLFVYASIVIHDNLTVAEAIAATNLPESIVIYAYKVGLDAGFLYGDGEGRDRISPLWQIQLISLLNKKNFLHE